MPGSSLSVYLFDIIRIGVMQEKGIAGVIQIY